MSYDVRWIQRFDNLERAFLFLEKACQQAHFSPLEAAGLVQSFEFTFELAWKTLKDYLNQQGVDVKYPRDTIKHAFKTELIQNGHIWIDMLDKRNELTHTYNEEQAKKAVEMIQGTYLPVISQVYRKLKELS